MDTKNLEAAQGSQRGPDVLYITTQKLRDERDIRVFLVWWAPKLFGLGDVMCIKDMGVRLGMPQGSR